MSVSRTKLVALGLVIFSGVLVLYWPSTHGGFLTRMDDAEYLRQSVRWNGLTWNAVQRAFTCTQPYWQPLARLSHVLDYQMWGKNAAGHHATSVFLHALNAALVFGFLWTLLGASALTTGKRLMVALWVAVVFAIHPLQVESVAWMSCRTQLLCGMFGIGSVWAYAAGARRWVVWGLYAAALLSQPIAVSLPFVMLAIDYFPLRRYEQLGWGRLLRDKAVLVAIAVAVGVATMITESRVMVPWGTVPLSQRVLLMCQSLMFYLWKLVWPVHLSPTYPLQLGLSLRQWQVLVPVLGVGIITTLAMWGRLRLPAVAVAWGAYLVFVLPISGLMQAWGMAARYAYVAVLPPLLLFGGAGVWMWRRSTTAARLALVGLLAGELCVLAAGTRSLIPDWHDDETLQRAILTEFPDSEFDNQALAQTLLDQGRAGEALVYAQRAVEVAPQLWQAHMALGAVLCRLGRLQEAMAQHEQAFRMNGNSAQAHYNLGIALVQMEKIDDAVAHYEQALRINPDYAEVHFNLGNALFKLEQTTEAAAQYQEALRIKPDYAEAQSNLGLVLAQTGKIEEAIAHYRQALQIQPDDAAAHSNLGNALVRTRKIKEAIAHYQQALWINPDYAEAHYNLGLVLVKTGRVPEAIEQYKQALLIEPGLLQAHYDLAITLEKAGKLEEAIAHYEQALQIQPCYATVHYSLGNALAQAGKTEEAIALYEQALQINPDYAEAHFNLGNALFKLGRTTEAVAQYQEALRIQPDDAEAHSNLGLALTQMDKIEEAIAHYQQALWINPDYAEAHYNLGIALAQTGKIAEATAQYEQALQIKPDYAEAHSNLGNALAQAGKSEEAIAHYQQALWINPNYAEVHYNLGTALQRQGRVPEAIEAYEQALKLRADFTAASNALAQLKAGQTGR